MPVDHSSMRLGYLRATAPNILVPMVSQILVDGVASAPPSNSWSKGRTDWNMLANNIVGDCTIAGFLHILMVAARILGLDYNPTDAEALALYTAITGYNPRAPLVNGENPTDQGATLEQVVAYLLQHPIDGFSFLGQALVNITDMNDVALAAYNFPGLYTGVNLPLISQNQEIWDVTPWDLSTNRNAQPGSWGGHCLAPGTRLLTESLEWVPVEKLGIGDFLIGFDEYTNGSRRRYHRSIVQSYEILELPCYDLEFGDGTKIRAASDHLWLVRNGDESQQWLETEKMRPIEGVTTRGKPYQYPTQVLKPLEPWETDNSRDGGYLAAAFDGEGWLSTGGTQRGIHKMGFCQRENPMLDRVKKALEERDFLYTQSTDESGFVPGNTVEQLRIGGRQNLLRFLGSIRPHRLLTKFDVESIGFLQAGTVPLVRMTFVGDQTVVSLGTSTRTYIAEGFASHNCINLMDYDLDAKKVVFCTWGEPKVATFAWWKAYVEEARVLLPSDWLKSSLSPNGVNETALETYMQGYLNPSL